LPLAPYFWAAIPATVFKRDKDVRRRVLLAVACIGIFWVGGPVRSEENCQLKEITSLDIQTDEVGRVYLPASIAGQPENLLLSTESAYSALAARAVKALDLRQVLSGLYNIADHSFVRAQYESVASLQLGSLTNSQFKFLVIPDEGIPLRAAGVLSFGVFGDYDVELDFAHGKLNLFLPHHCRGQVVYWTHGIAARVPIATYKNGMITAPVTLDGRQLTAILAIDGSDNRMSLQYARSVFGNDYIDAGLKPLGSTQSSPYSFPFKSLSLGGLAVSSRTIALYDAPTNTGIVNPSPALNIGEPTLREIHIYISHNEGYLYATAADAH